MLCQKNGSFSIADFRLFCKRDTARKFWALRMSFLEVPVYLSWLSEYPPILKYLSIFLFFSSPYVLIKLSMKLSICLLGLSECTFWLSVCPFWLFVCLFGFKYSFLALRMFSEYDKKKNLWQSLFNEGEGSFFYIAKVLKCSLHWSLYVFVRMNIYALVWGQNFV